MCIANAADSMKGILNKAIIDDNNQWDEKTMSQSNRFVQFGS
jgi:hypothetical protein